MFIMVLFKINADHDGSDIIVFRLAQNRCSAMEQFCSPW